MNWTGGAKVRLPRRAICRHGWQTGMSDELDVRRRRAAWRAAHRGTKEMDVLLGRYAQAQVSAMAEPALARFEQFLALPDPELQKWLLTAPSRGQGGEFADLVVEVRAFHGLLPLPVLTGRGSE
jgi:antitoxin CptB